MRTKLARWGDSFAVRLPERAVEKLRLVEGATIEMKIERGALSLRPAQPQYRLKNLLRGVTPARMRTALASDSDDDGLSPAVRGLVGVLPKTVSVKERRRYLRQKYRP